MRKGVIGFTLKLKAAPPLPDAEHTEIESWRQRLRKAGVLGQDPERYGGYGFGNISRRLAPFTGMPAKRRFLITGSQTGAIPRLSPAHYAVVRECHVAQHLVVADGSIPPSSESLTHGILYAMDDTLRWVMHVHCPALWRSADLLGLPKTSAAAAQGDTANVGGTAAALCANRPEAAKTLCHGWTHRRYGVFRQNR